MVFFLIKKLMERLYLRITEKFLLWTFLEWEIQSFLSQNADAKMTFTNYWKCLVLNFSGMGNTVFFLSQNVDGKMIFTNYWRSSCFELFSNEKIDLFSVKKFVEIWYFLGLFEFSMIFQDLGNMVFRTVWMEVPCRTEFLIPNCIST